LTSLAKYPEDVLGIVGGAIPEGMQRAGNHKGIREKREDVKVIYLRLLSTQPAVPAV